MNDSNGAFNSETEAFFRRWVKITASQLEQALGKHRIHQTGALESGLNAKVSELGDKLLAEFYFKLYGRFVDMGKGAIANPNSHPTSHPAIESTESNRLMILGTKKRKPKPWYSKTFFGRLDNLRGGIGYKMKEIVMQTIRQSIDS